MEQRVSLITLGVADVPRSRAFYKKLGWKTGGPSDDNVAFFQAGGMIVALWGNDALAHDGGFKAASPGGYALAQNVRRKSDVDKILAQAVKAGAKLLKPAQDAFWGGRQGYFADPDGHPWEIAWNPSFTITKSGATKLPRPKKKPKRKT